jgi:hypothetical protein
MTHSTSGQDLEAALGRSFSVPVPLRSREVIDRRVESAIAHRTARRTSRVRGFHFPMAARRLLVGVAAAVLLTGTVAAGGTIFSRLIGNAPLMENVWDRATEIGQSSTDAGYTIHFERAAADREHVWVILSVTATSGPAADIGRLRIVDANGIVIGGGTGAGTGDVHSVTAALYGLNVPAGITPHGPYTLEVTSVTTGAGDIEMSGHWTFTFDVPLTAPFGPGPANATVRPDAP